MTKIELISIAPHPTPITCTLCKDLFRPHNGPWPAVPIDNGPAMKLVCTDCAAEHEPAKDYGAPWPAIIAGIERGAYVEDEAVARDKTLEDLDREVARRTTAAPT